MSSIEHTRPAEGIETPSRPARPAGRPGLGASDLLLAAGAGLLVALSPLSTNDLLPSTGLGLLAAGALLAHRRQRALQGLAAPGERLRLSPGESASFGILLLAWGAALAPVLDWLYQSWTTNLWNNGHGLFIPPAVAYLGWRALRALPEEQARGSAWGFAFLLPALALAAAASATGLLLLGAVGLVLTLPGLALLLYGRRGTRALLVPLVVAALMVPIPNAVASHMYLRQLTAWIVGEIFGAMGFLAVREGTVIQTANQVFVVADACSGFSTLYASLSVALILGAMAGSLRTASLLLAAAIPLALTANVARVLGLVVFTDQLGLWVLESPLHAGSGIATFVVSLGGLFWLYDRRGRGAPAP